MKLFFQIVGFPFRLGAALVLLTIAGGFIGFLALFTPEFATSWPWKNVLLWVLHGEPSIFPDGYGDNL